MAKLRNIAIAAITLIGTVNTIGYSYLTQNQDAFNEYDKNHTLESSSVEDNAISNYPTETTVIDNQSIDNNDDIKPIETDKADNDILSQNTDRDTTTEPDNNELNPEINENSGAEYSIRNIMTNISYNNLYNDFWTLDRDTDSVFVIEYDGSSYSVSQKYSTLSKVSISSGESENIITDNKLKEVVYNPFTSDTYAFFEDWMCNLTTGTIYNYDDYRNFTSCKRFVDENELISIKSLYAGVGKYEYDVSGDTWQLNNGTLNKYKTGYIAKAVPYLEPIKYIQPVITNDCYYWVIENGTYNLFYTMYSVKDRLDDCQSPIESFDAIACTVCENEVYFMSSDFSVYKLNMELMEGKEPIGTNTSGEKNIYANQTSESLNKYCSLYLDGNKIKQTGKTNLNSINSFYIRNNGDIVVFDTFDSTIKVIEKN